MNSVQHVYQEYGNHKPSLYSLSLLSCRMQYQEYRFKNLTPAPLKGPQQLECHQDRHSFVPDIAPNVQEAFHLLLPSSMKQHKHVLNSILKQGRDLSIMVSSQSLSGAIMPKSICGRLLVGIHIQEI